MLHVITLLLSTLNRSNDFNSRVINNRSYQLHETVCELRNSNMISSLLFFCKLVQLTPFYWCNPLLQLKLKKKSTFQTIAVFQQTPWEMQFSLKFQTIVLISLLLLFTFHLQKCAKTRFVTFGRTGSTQEAREQVQKCIRSKLKSCRKSYRQLSINSRNTG